MKTYAHVFCLDPLAPPARHHNALALAFSGEIDESLRCIDEGIEALGEPIMQRETKCVVLEIVGDAGKTRMRFSNTRWHWLKVSGRRSYSCRRIHCSSVITPMPTG